MSAKHPVIGLDDRNIGAHDAGLVLGVSDDTIYRMWDAGELPFVRVGKRRTISLADLREWKRANTVRLGAR